MTYEPKTYQTKLHYELPSIRENEMERSCRSGGGRYLRILHLQK